jgi:tetratricopeptide (TPR) repeat protein
MPPTVSLCMIVKNEEADLPLCLNTAADLVKEIIVVDTGSTDGTRQVAARFGARVFDFPWIDNFAAARNESIRHATGQWIFWLDADDRIDEPNRQRLRQLFANLPDKLYGFIMTYLALREAPSGRDSPADHVQLFPNHPEIRWEYRVHEQILRSIERLGGQAVRTDIVIHHLGYQDYSIVRQKLERNLRLGQFDLADRPDDPVVLFNLGRSTLRLGQIAESVPILERALTVLPANWNITGMTYALLVEALGRTDRKPEALTVCLQGRDLFPNDNELLWAESLLRLSLGDMRGGETCLVELLRREPGHEKARQYLARLRPAQGFQINIGM